MTDKPTDDLDELAALVAEARGMANAAMAFGDHAEADRWLRIGQAAAFRHDHLSGRAFDGTE